MLASLALSNDATTSNDQSSHERGPQQRGSHLDTPAQVLVERAYQVQIMLRPLAFAAATVVLLVLFGAAVYFVVKAHDVIQARYDSMSAAQEPRAGATQGPLAPAPPPVLCCYYDPAWANETLRGDWAYDLLQHFRHEHCSHAVFVGAQYRDRAIELPDYVTAALEQFLSLRRRGLSVLASVFVVDAGCAAQESGHFASTTAAWLRRHGFQGAELDVGRNSVSTGYDALVKALSKELRAHLPLLVLSVNIYPELSFMKHVNVKEIHDDADILVLNTQDLVNDDQVTAAHSALYGKHSWNTSLAAVYALTGSLSQLVPVVPFTSREFELQEPLPGRTSVSAGLSCHGHADLTPYHSAAGYRAFFEVREPEGQRLLLHAGQRETLHRLGRKRERHLQSKVRGSPPPPWRSAQAHGCGRIPVVARVWTRSPSAERGGHGDAPATAPPSRRTAPMDARRAATHRGASQWQDGLPQPRSLTAWTAANLFC
ncbi:uncharacterized protein [Dermacentor albipictus]|uniref:uncharacterized protein isoform X2 n=1 Tax=Dermacentor albipictus TaxID=60249 RepID=UPI0031FC51DD